MNCRSAESLFSSFVEDEISQHERRAFEAHLMQCRKCSIGLRELRATMRVLRQDLAHVATSPHFEEDLMARIRSGEALRPSVGDWVRGLLAPSRLKPVFMAGAGVCAIWIAVMTWPLGRPAPAPPAPPTVAVAPPSAPPTVAAAHPSASVSPGPEASAPESSPMTSRPSRVAGAPAASLVVSAAQASPAFTDSIVDSQMPEQLYRDEVINDQFYLDRGQSQQGPAIVPVNSRGDDGVHITF